MSFVLIFLFTYSLIAHAPILVIDSDEENQNSCDMKAAPDAISDGDLSAETMINILLINPQDYEPKERPRGIRKNYVCTLDVNKVSIAVAKSDDNGAYIKRGSPKRLYHVKVTGNEISVAQVKICNDAYYVNHRTTETQDNKNVLGARYKKEFVKADEVYELQRQYRVSKSNNGFSNIIVTIRKVEQEKIEDYYLLIYRWNDDCKINEENFVLERHGNAKKPHAPTYFRQNPSLMEKAKDALQSGSSCSNVYNRLTKEAKV